MEHQNAHWVCIIPFPLKGPSRVKKGYVVNLYAWVVDLKVTSAINAITEEPLMNTQFIWKKKHLLSWGVSWLNSIFNYPGPESPGNLSNVQVRDDMLALPVDEHLSHGLLYRLCVLWNLLGAISSAKTDSVLVLSCCPDHLLPTCQLPCMDLLAALFSGLEFTFQAQGGLGKRGGNIARIPSPVVMQTLIPLIPQWQLLATGVCTLLEYFT